MVFIKDTAQCFNRLESGSYVFSAKHTSNSLGNTLYVRDLRVTPWTLLTFLVFWLYGFLSRNKATIDETLGVSVDFKVTDYLLFFALFPLRGRGKIFGTVH